MKKKEKQSKKELNNSKAKRKVAIKFYGRKIGGYLALLSTIFLFGFLFEKTIETFMILLGYVATRFCMPKIKHFNSTKKCITISTSTFLIFICIIALPNNIALIWNVIAGCFIPIIMYIESLIFDKVKTKEDEVKDLCMLHKYNEIKTEMAIKFFVKNEKPRDVWLWLCEKQGMNAMEWDSVKHLKWKMKKELFGNS
ncbi:MAG: accessory gene regulator B family protein [Firmicutes bacterium]|nr:accessory gene regulator B family protein [Candidatus Caballimonas caccae]